MLGEMWQFRGRYKILHMTWFAFFLSFVVWFNLAPLATSVKADLGLEVSQIRTIAICNVALTVPARIIIGMLLDKFGPRLTYSILRTSLNIITRFIFMVIHLLYWNLMVKKLKNPSIPTLCYLGKMVERKLRLLQTTLDVGCTTVMSLST